MSTTILKRQWVQGKKSKKDPSFSKKQNTRFQQVDSVSKLHDIIQELTYGVTKDAIEKKLASANKQWMKIFFNNKKL